MQQFEVIFYTKKDGTEPAKDFILSLDKKLRAKTVLLIDMLADNGPKMREPYSKALGDGIFEIRAQAGSDISRVLYFFIVGHKIILTNGFIKKTEKTPATEIKRAKRYRNDFLIRMEQTK